MAYRVGGVKGLWASARGLEAAFLGIIGHTRCGQIFGDRTPSITQDNFVKVPAHRNALLEAVTGRETVCMLRHGHGSRKSTPHRPER
jgi:hypothetical protein